MMIDGVLVLEITACGNLGVRADHSSKRFDCAD